MHNIVYSLSIHFPIWTTCNLIHPSTGSTQTCCSNSRLRCLDASDLRLLPVHPPSKVHPFFYNHQPKCWTKTFGRIKNSFSTSLEEKIWVHILKMSLEGGLWQSIGILEVPIWSTANSTTKAQCYQSWSLDFTVTKDASKSKKVSSVASLLTFRTTKDPAYI